MIRSHRCRIAVSGNGDAPLLVVTRLLESCTVVIARNQDGSGIGAAFLGNGGGLIATAILAE